MATNFNRIICYHNYLLLLVDNKSEACCVLHIHEVYFGEWLYIQRFVNFSMSGRSLFLV